MLERRMLYRSIILSLIVLVLIALSAQAHRSILHSQQALASAELFTKTLLEHMEDAVLTIDAQGIVTFFNRRAEVLFGISAENIVGKQVTSILPYISTIFETTSESTHPKELSISTPNGKRIVSVVLTHVEQRQTAVFRDITNLKHMEQELHQRERLSAMGSLAAGVAHEIRNPLNAISILIQRLQQEFSPRKGAREYTALLDVLKKEIARLNAIIQQFLRFSRPPQLVLTEVSLQQFLRHVVHLFEGEAHAKEIQFSVDCALNETVYFDQDQMTQALLNLLRNALEATSQGGSVSLRVWKDKETLFFAVADTGAGIPTELQTKIFDLYFTTKPSGTGIGFPMAMQIVQQHGGFITIESEEGKGSIFIISLPQKKISSS